VLWEILFDAALKLDCVRVEAAVPAANETGGSSSAGFATETVAPTDGQL
jgi:hypothetical protein